MSEQYETKILLEVKEAAELARSTAKSFYVYLSNTGANGGSKRPKFPPEIYIKFGRKTLFIKDKFLNWLQNGAQMVQETD